MDFNGHGTHVAGTIGATGNNSTGTTGVAWTTTIMPIRVMDSLGSGTTANISSGIDYAVANGAKIINMSLGGSFSSATMMSAISSANSAGVLVVVAAGNDGSNNEVTHVYPSDYTNANIISVAATDQNDALASFSNYGTTSVDVGAPGTNIYSLQPARETILSEDFESGATGWTTTTTSGNTWVISSLTSHGGSKSLDDGSGAGNYPANNDASTISPNFSLFRSGCLLTFWYNYVTEPTVDKVFVSVSTNGGAYSDLVGTPVSGTSAGWTKATFDLKPYEGNFIVSVRFRLTSDGLSNFDGVHVDDFSVTCSSTTFTGSEYEYLNGTSMAAPHVAGLAALLLAQNSSLTVTELKALILDNGDSISALNGKTVTGKRINAYNSLFAGDVTAPSSSISINGNAFYITSTSVTLTLSATDAIGVTGYYVSETSTTPSASSFTSITSTTSYSANNISFTLSSGDGTKTVYAWFKDAAGNISLRASDTISYATPTPTTPTTSSSGGGGGGGSTSGIDILLFLALAGILKRKWQHAQKGQTTK